MYPELFSINPELNTVYELSRVLATSWQRTRVEIVCTREQFLAGPNSLAFISSGAIARDALIGEDKLNVGVGRVVQQAAHHIEHGKRHRSFADL